MSFMVAVIWENLGKFSLFLFEQNEDAKTPENFSLKQYCKFN
jgi:hypothetical protein